MFHWPGFLNNLHIKFQAAEKDPYQWWSWSFPNAVILVMEVKSSCFSSHLCSLWTWVLIFPSLVFEPKYKSPFFFVTVFTLRPGSHSKISTSLHTRSVFSTLMHFQASGLVYLKAIDLITASSWLHYTQLQMLLRDNSPRKRMLFDSDFALRVHIASHWYPETCFWKWKEYL